MTVQEFIHRRNRYFTAIAVPGLLEIAIICLPPLVLLVSLPPGSALPGGSWMNLLLLGLFLFVYAVT